MKAEIAIYAVVSAGTLLLEDGPEKGTMIGGAVAALYSFAESRRARAAQPAAAAANWELCASLIAIFFGSYILTPLLAGWSVLSWIPRPDPLTVRWYAFAGLFGGLVAAVGMTFVVRFLASFQARGQRRADSAGRTIADALADRLHLPRTDTARPGILAEEQFHEWLATLTPEARAAVEAKVARKNDPGN